MSDSKTSSVFLSHDGLTDPLGQAQILPYMCGLAKSFSITIISFEKRDRFTSAEKDIRKICSAHNIIWIPLTYHKDPPLLSTLFDLYRLRRCLIKLYAEKKFAIVHCRSYVTALVGLWFKKKYRVKFIFDMRGFWPDERVEGGLWNLRNPLFLMVYNYFKRKELEFVRDADHIVVLTEAAKRIVGGWRINQAITVIPCCVDLALFNLKNISTEVQETLRNELGISSKDFVLLYLGSLGTWYLLDEMVSFYNVVKQQEPSAKFLILTPDLKMVPQDPGIIGMTVPRTQVPLFISISSACLCFIKPSYSKKASSATKMAEVLAMQVPVITNPGWGDVEFLQRKLTGLYVVGPEHQKFNVKELLNSRKLKQPTEFDMFFSLESGVSRYKQVYRSGN